MMKKLCVLLGLVAVGFTPVNAQIFQPSQVRGGIIGAVAGALIGGHNNDRWAEGAAIGAVAGTLLGTVADRDSYAPNAAVAGYGVGRVVVSSRAGYGYGGAQVRVVGNAPWVGSAPVIVAQPVVYVQSVPVQVIRRPQVVYYVAPAPVVVIGGYGHYARRGYYRSYGRRW